MGDLLIQWELIFAKSNLEERLYLYPLFPKGRGINRNYSRKINY